MNESESLVLPLHHSPSFRPSTTCPTNKEYYTHLPSQCQHLFVILQKLHFHIFVTMRADANQRTVT